MARRNWTDEEKAAALELLVDPEQSFYDVHKRTGVPASTLHDWAAAAGLTGHSDRLRATEAARTFRSERIALKRAVLAEKFLDQAELLSDRSAEVADGLIEVKEGIFIATGADSLAYMRAAKEALASFRLEMGEHTQATRSDTSSPRDRVKDRVDELEAKRQQRSA